MPTAVIYARVSTVKQAEDELPIASQVERCEEKAKALEATVERVFKDEGISGSTDARPAFQECIDYCNRTTPDFLITWSTSRFARNKVDAGLYKLQLEKAGVNLVYVSQAFDRSTDAGWMTESILELFDEFYSRQVAADTTRAMIKNARDGYWNGGMVVFGYRAEVAPDNPKRKRLVMNPVEAVVVEEVFNLRLAGMGAKAIADTLTDRGVTNRGRKWNKKSVLHLLQNPAVMGCTVFGRHDKKTKRLKPPDEWIVVPSFEPILSKDTFDQVRALMNESTPIPGEGSSKSTWLFTGMMRCPDGLLMQIKSGRGRTKRYYYYACRAQDGGETMKPIRADQFDPWMLSIVMDRILTPENLLDVVKDLRLATRTWEKEHMKRLQKVQAALTDLANRNNRLYDVLELQGQEAPNLGDLADRLQTNKKSIHALEKKLMDINAEEPPALDVSDEDAAELAGALRYIISSSEDPKTVRNFLKGFIEGIQIGPDGVQINYHPGVLVMNREQAPVHSSGRWGPGRALLGTRVIRASLPLKFRKTA